MGWEQRRSRFVFMVGAFGVLGACGAGESTPGAGTDTRDVVFTEILVPDVTVTDSVVDVADTASVPDVPDTLTADPDSAPDTEPDSGPDTELDSGPDTETIVDTADTTEPVDTRDTTETTPDPFCGDSLCNGDEDCLTCLDCTCPERCGADLFLSEYIEGPTGFNKALEIMNATGREVDLAGYAIWKITNGGDWSETTPVALSGSLAPGDVFVVCHASASAAILAACDQQSSSSTLEFNGNDAVGLARQGALVDAIGEAGADPGAAFPIDGVADATKDHRLVRQAAVVDGSADWSVAAPQWDVLAYAEAGLGAHAVAATCDPQLPPPAVINEIRLGSGASDFIEIVAAGDPVDLGGWKIATTGGQLTLPTGSSAMLAAGGFRAVSRAELGFGLGVVDIVWLYDADGALQDVVGVAADTIGDDQSWGRLPDFDGAFQGLALATPGAPNVDPEYFCGDLACDIEEDCASCADDCGACRPLPGELVITEVLAAPTAGPEWLEVTNVSIVPLELAGLVVVDDATDFHTLAPAGGSLLVQPGARVVFGSGAAAHVDIVYSGFALDAEGDEIELVGDGDIIDRIVWTSAPTPSGTAWSLDPLATDTVDNDDPIAWCAAVDAGPDGQLGTPGTPNPSCTTSSCDDATCDPDETCESCPEDCGPCPGGCAADLFLSEYVEGESGANKKAIEIANFTGQPVNLGQYALRKISNGGSTWADADFLGLTGTLAHGDVYVVCNSSSIAELLPLCDLAVGSQVVNFNGNDAVALAFGSTVIDTIGEETAPDPSAWTVAGVVLATQDHVLVRKPEVTGPTTDWPTSATTGWSVLAPGEFSGLGSHTYSGTCP